MREIGKYFVGLLGAFLSVIEPTLPIVTICIVFVLWDCLSAWELSRRVKKRFPGANDGKFKSNYAGRVIVTIIKAFAAIVLADMVQRYITNSFYILDLPRLVAGIICGWQIWSILENESSCNNAKWAIVLQKILVDKTERHFDIDLSDLRDDIGDEYAAKIKHKKRPYKDGRYK